MRIIAGIWKGKTIQSPNEGTRPSTDRTRQALFSILQNVTEEARVLDLFAGSGALGLEALSRGAKKVIAVESDRTSCRVITRNTRSLGAKNYTSLQRDVLAYLDTPSSEQFDLIFADPPYEKDFSDSLLLSVLSHPCWEQRASAQAYFITESPQDLTKTGLIPACWSVVTKRNYGKCHITVLQRISES